MGVAAVVLALSVVVVIGAVIVLREVARLAHEPPAPVFDLDEAYDWVVEQLPDVVAATLTPDDVRRILDLQIEFFRRRGVSGNGSTPHPPGEVVISGSETVAYIIERAAATGDTYLPEQVFAVIDTQMAYLRAIGALHDVDGDAGKAG